jgi:hypothetical protein
MDLALLQRDLTALDGPEPSGTPGRRPDAARTAAVLQLVTGPCASVPRLLRLAVHQPSVLTGVACVLWFNNVYRLAALLGV